VTDPWRRRSFVVVDFETSGTDVVEVGAVQWRPWRALGTFQRLCRPARPIPPVPVGGAVITDEMVRGEPPFSCVLRELLDFVGDAILVAHNAPFDRAVLRAALARAGAELPNPFLDTLRLARRWFPEAPAHDLATLCWYHRIRREREHRALDDALATAELLRLLLECARDEGIATTADLLALGGPPSGDPRGTGGELELTPAEQALLEAAVVRGDALDIRTRSPGGRERTRRVVPYVVDLARGVPRLVVFDVEAGETKVIPLDRLVAVAEAGD